MRKFKCSICGFIFDEAVGLPEKGISPGTAWEDVSPGFVCPWCGAPKSEFVEVLENKAAVVPAKLGEEPAEKIGESAGQMGEYAGQMGELSARERSAVFSNLAKGCEKQHLTEEMGLFLRISNDYAHGMNSAVNVKEDPEMAFTTKPNENMEGEGTRDASTERAGFAAISELLRADILDGYANASAVCAAEKDRGALRALVWSEKASRMASALLDRYAVEGDAMLENAKIHVCDICGFIYLGNDLPEVCPVCKVPNYKMTQIGRR